MSVVERPVCQNTVITTQATTLCRTGSGILERIIIPTLVASATIKIWDSLAASGTVLVDTITLPATLLSSGPVAFDLGISFQTGLTVVTAGATMSLTVMHHG